jgi:hypothetical protein
MSFIKNKRLISICLFTLSSFSFAANSNNHLYLGGMVGASFLELGDKSDSITYFDGNLTDTYRINNQNQTRTILGINGGYEWAGQGLTPAIGLGLGAYTNPSQYSFAGQVSESAGGDPSFLLYNNRFHVRTSRLMAELQLAWQVRCWMPFVNAGIGPAWNYVSGYAESVATPDGFVALPPFRSRTNAQFAYQAGFGLGYAFDFTCPTAKRERISVGYRYVNAGDASFGTRGSVYPYRLNLGTISSNDVYLSYTHLF